MVRRPGVVFDIDGTLLHNMGPVVYESATSIRQLCVPVPASCARLRQLWGLYDVWFLTGRSEAVRPITLKQLRGCIHHNIKPEHLIMQREWVGYDEMTAYKAGHLERIRPVLYVGDHEADREAARRAGIRFLSALEWRLGASMTLAEVPKEAS